MDRISKHIFDILTPQDLWVTVAVTANTLKYPADFSQTRVSQPNSASLPNPKRLKWSLNQNSGKMDTN